jgi:outer membrane protease
MFMVINSVYCQETAEKKYGFSIAPQLGFVYGQALEFVYNPPGAEREILSELIWEMKPVFYYGLYVDFGRIDLMSRPGFFASVSFKAGIPADSGVMEDRDWYQGVPPINENDDFTHFSSSTNKTREFFWLDVVVGASIPVKSLFYIKPFLSGSWTRFSFIAKDGYAMYPSGQESFEGEEVCNYQQDWFLSALGISVGTNILSPFSFDLSFQISPFTYCVAVDEHFKRKTKTEDDTLIFRDYTSMGLFL